MSHSPYEPRPVPVALRVLARALRGGGAVRCSPADAEAVQIAMAGPKAGRWCDDAPSGMWLEVDPDLRPGEIEVLR